MNASSSEQGESRDAPPPQVDTRPTGEHPPTVVNGACGPLLRLLRDALTRPAAKAALDEALLDGSDTTREALAAQIRIQVERDAEFRKAIEAFLPVPDAGVRQSISNVGSGNAIVQVAGSGNSVSVSASALTAPSGGGAPTRAGASTYGGASSAFDHDVFLCHNSKDADVVLRLAERLKVLGINPWLDRWSLRRDREHRLQLVYAVNVARCAVVLLGRHGIGPWQEVEVSVAVERYLRDRPSGLVVALLPGADDPPELPRDLVGLPRVDLRGVLESSDDERLRVLIASVFGKPPEQLGDAKISRELVDELRRAAQELG